MLSSAANWLHVWHELWHVLQKHRGVSSAEIGLIVGLICGIFLLVALICKHAYQFINCSSCRMLTINNMSS